MSSAKHSGQYIYSVPPLSSPLCPPPTHTHNKKASYGPVKEDIKISSNIILQLQQSFLSNPLFLLVIGLNHQSSTVFLVWFWWTSSHTCWSSVTQKLWFVHLSTLFKVQKLHFEEVYSYISSIYTVFFHNFLESQQLQSWLFISINRCPHWNS